jgi:hypothetical protein
MTSFVTTFVCPVFSAIRETSSFFVIVLVMSRFLSPPPHGSTVREGKKHLSGRRDFPYRLRLPLLKATEDSKPRPPVKG